MSESDLPAGTVIANRYVVGAELGAGAMGSVHLAEQTALDRMVAIKVLRTDGPVFADVMVDKVENCFPMIPSGSAHNDMILGPVDRRNREVSEAGKALV